MMKYLNMIPIMTFVFTTLMFTGCGGLGTAVTMQDYPDIKPFDYEVNFVLSSSTEFGPDTQEVNPFAVIDTAKLNKIWNKITNESSKIAFTSDTPKYHFDIELLALLDRYIASGPTKDYYGGCIFKLSVLDNRKNIIQSRLFKITGYWYSDGFGAEGPAKMGMFGVSEAIIKLALYDILSYVSREDFLSSQSVGIYKVDHILPDMKFKLPADHVVDYDGSFISTSGYDFNGVAVVYFNYIMGENFSQESELGNLSWKEGDPQRNLWVARIAHKNNWPMFPAELKLTGNYRID